MEEMTKEKLNFMCIKTYYINYNNQELHFSPLDIKQNQWKISVCFDAVLHEIIELVVTDMDDNQTSTTCSVQEINENYLILNLDTQLPDNIHAFIQETENNTLVFNKRKEIRYTVGIEGAKKFALNATEQEIFANGIITPCLVNNISLHGISIVTFKKCHFEENDEISIYFNFTQPDEEIIIQGNVIRKFLKKGTKKEFAFHSVSFNDPISYNWQLRVSAYADTLGK